MLAFPTVGLSRSTHEHNIDVAGCADWVEGSLFFTDTATVSATEVIHELLGQYIYDDDDFCAEGVDIVWEELRNRARWLGGGTPYEVKGRTVARNVSWEECPSLSFCIILSQVRVYGDFAQKLGPDYTEQGELFERLAEASTRAHMPGWQTLRTGWSTGQPRKIKDVVHTVADELRIQSNAVAPWADETANEQGLDVVIHRPFPDARAGTPIYLMQCASGKHWVRKRRDPALETWMKLLTFVNGPSRALAIPFALSEDEFQQTSNLVDGLVLDRNRLASVGNEPEAAWLPGQLAEELRSWVDHRLNLMSAADDLEELAG